MNERIRNILIILSVLLLAAIVAIELYAHFFTHSQEPKAMDMHILNVAILSAVALYSFFLIREATRSRKKINTLHKQLGLMNISSDTVVMEYRLSDKRFIRRSTTSDKPSREFGVDDYLSRIHPDDRYMARQLLDFMNSRKNEPYACEYRYVFPEKKDYFWQYNDIYPYEYDRKGRVLRYIGICRTNNKSHKQEEELERFRRKVSFITHLNGILFTHYDVALDRFFQLDETGQYADHEIPFEQYWSSIHPSDLPKAQALVAFLREHKGRTFHTEYRYRLLKNSHHTWFVVDIAASGFDDNGNITDYICLSRDNDLWRNTMDEMRRLRDEAESANRLKSAFLANMSHEIRTPLNSIVGFSSLLQETGDKQERAEYMQIINTNSEQLLKLVNDILDLSKIEAGVIECKREKMDMAAKFNELVQSLRNNCSNPDIEVVLDNPYEKCIVECDVKRMSQVLTNFTTNALKYTEKGFVKIGYQQCDGGVRIYVEDSGIGIPDEQKCKIFQRFEKLNNFAPGIGLGLSICKAIVESCGGKIGFDSTQGKGSTFWAWSPCAVIETVEKPR